MESDKAKEKEPGTDVSQPDIAGNKSLGRMLLTAHIRRFSHHTGLSNAVLLLEKGRKEGMSSQTHLFGAYKSCPTFVC